MSAMLVRHTMEHALTAIQGAARHDATFWPELRSGRGLKLDDLLALRLDVSAGAPAALFDHRLFERVFVLHPLLIDAYAEYWQAVALQAELSWSMCELFLLHELLHVEQSANSDVYLLAGPSSLDLFAGLDYFADARALRLAFHLNGPARSESERRSLWLRLLAAQFHGGRVFGRVDHASPLPTAPDSSMDGPRLRRQSVWALQYARAAAHLHDTNAWDVALGERIDWHWLPIEESRLGPDLCDAAQVQAEALTHGPIQANFTLGERMVRHPWLLGAERQALAAMLFSGDLSRWNEAYRGLFDAKPFLTGREAGPSPAEPELRPAPTLTQTQPAAPTGPIFINQGGYNVGSVNNYGAFPDPGQKR